MSRELAAYFGDVAQAAAMVVVELRLQLFFEAHGFCEHTHTFRTVRNRNDGCKDAVAMTYGRIIGGFVAKTLNLGIPHIVITQNRNPHARAVPLEQHFAERSGLRHRRQESSTLPSNGANRSHRGL